MEADADRPPPGGFDLADNDGRSTETRLGLLHDLAILNTAPEAAFEDIVLMAAQICGTPISLISLVDRERQWFKARLNFAPSETTLDRSVCVHAIEGGTDILVVPDLAEDARTRHNALVTGPPRIRFYAGAPLVVDGVAIGSLCVIDHAPRPDGLTAMQATTLGKLARQVVAQMQLRRSVAERDELVRQLRQAHELAAGERQRFAAMFERAPSFMAMLRGPRHVFEMVNPAYRKLVGGRDVVGKPVAEALPDAAAQGFVETLDRVHATGEPFVMEAARFAARADPDGPVDERFLDFVYQPVSHDGRVEGIFVEGYDVTERVRQIRRQEALADLGDRLRDLDDVGEIAHAAANILATALDATRAGFGTVDIATETVAVHRNWCAPGSKPIDGVHRFRDYGTFIDDLKAGRSVFVDDVTKDVRTRDRAEALLGLGVNVMLNLPIMEHGKCVLLVFVHHDRLKAISPADLALVQQVGDRTQAAIARVRAELRQRVLNHELGHRLKNTLAMVQAIASQTLKTVGDREAVDALSRRLGALGAAHDVLLHQTWSAAPMRDVVAKVLGTFDMPDRFRLFGPDLDLGARAALSLTLVLHELTTNAVKYGALSAEGGHVDVTWGVEPGDGDEAFVVRWREVGGPPAKAPTGRTGFGSRLIRMGLLGAGGVDIDYASGGMRVTMTAPLDGLRQS